MRIRSLILLSGLLPSALLAQADTARGEVEGTVYDSVARRPVAGAVVQMVNVAAPAGPLLMTRTDARGRYAIRDIPPARYVLGFQDAALDSLALEAPQVLVHVGAGKRERIDLAVPAPSRIVATTCNARAADSTALILGVLRDAATGLPRGEGQAEARWTDILIERGSITRQEQSLVGPVTAEGWFAICVPAGDAILLRGASGADTSGVQLLEAPPNQVRRHDIVLGGTAVVRGLVRTEKERPLPNAHVAFAGTKRTTTTDGSGAFVLIGPAGTQTFEVRALGHLADRRPLSLQAGADTVIDVALVPIQRLLDTVRITASRVYSRDSDGFERRRRSGNGRFWGPEDIDRGRYHSIHEVLRQSPVVTISQNGFETYLSMRGGPEGRCVPAVYLNGIKLMADLGGDLDLLVRPDEISGMELYSQAQVPAQYQALVGCGSLVIWTRPRPRAPR